LRSTYRQTVGLFAEDLSTALEIALLVIDRDG